MNITIRHEESRDITEIDAITKAAFSASSYGLNNEPEIIKALRKADALVISLVAENDTKLVGHVAVSPVQISDRAEGWYGLGPLSVLPEYQRQGIGATLIQEVLNGLRRQSAAGCVLVGEPAYYARFGFNNSPDLKYPGIPGKYFQALKFGASMPVGVVSYHEAFMAES